MTAVGSPLTAADMLRYRSIGDVALSADGERVAYAVGGSLAEREARATSSLEVVATRPGAVPELLVGGDAAYALPAWSPDGTRLAFASDRLGVGSMRLFVRSPAGAIASVGTFAGTVEQLRWSVDGSALVVLVAEPGSDRAGARGGTRIDGEADGPGPAVHRPAHAWRRLHRVDATSGATTRIGPDHLNVWEFGWAGAGPIAAVVSPDPSEGAWYDATLALIDLDDATARIVHRPADQIQSPAIDAGGRRVAFVEGLASDRVEVQGVVSVVDVDGTDEPRLERLAVEAMSVAWLADGRLRFAGQDGIGTTYGTVTRDGRIDVAWRGPMTLGQQNAVVASASADGRFVAAVLDAPAAPLEVGLLDTTAAEPAWRRLTAVNAALRERRAPPAERVAWTAADGLEIEGILVRPVDAPAEQRLPLVVLVHGGPTNAWTASFSPGSMHLGVALLEAGYALLLPNVRGSSGRGQEFARRNVGDMGGGDLADIVAGVAALHDRGSIDRERVGITGVSYGGFMSAWAPTQGGGFAAAVPIACVSDWFSFHHTTNIPRFDELLLRSDPYEPGGEYFRRSPVAHARRCRTPTLLLHGAEDRCTPVGQAHEHYQALVAAGCETELVVYPRAGHGWSEPGQVTDTWARTCAWFARHLPGATATADPSDDTAG